MLLLDVVEQLQPVELRALQPDVEKHQAWPARRDRRKRAVAVARGARFVALVLQDTRDQLADIGLVIDDEDVRRHVYRSLAASRTADGFWDSGAGPLTDSAAKRNRTHAPRPPEATSGASNSSI